MSACTLTFNGWYWTELKMLIIHQFIAKPYLCQFRGAK
jgi:hypothetical protein